jgi:hypothetical protein
MLQNVLAILAKHEVMSETMLAHRLNMSVDALTPMMKLLIQRGQIELVQSGDCSGGCGCVLEQKLAYRWLGNSQRSVTPLHVISVT